VYFDPPYAPVSSTSDFTTYVPDGFGWEHQERLAQVACSLADRGVKVMISNSSTDRLKRLYQGFRIDPVQASRSINSKADKRGAVTELVIRSYYDDRGAWSARQPLRTG
jgi:DNA adenine methylase